MIKFRFDKLVRDKIVEQQLATGSKPVYRKLSDAEHKAALVAKIAEEAAEVPLDSTDKVKVAGELADVQQALDDLRDKLGISATEVAEQQAAKAAKVGAFKYGIFISTVEVDEHDPWIAHWRKNAERYPEVTDENANA